MSVYHCQRQCDPGNLCWPEERCRRCSRYDYICSARSYKHKIQPVQNADFVVSTDQLATLTSSETTGFTQDIAEKDVATTTSPPELTWTPCPNTLRIPELSTGVSASATSTSNGKTNASTGTYPHSMNLETDINDDPM